MADDISAVLQKLGLSPDISEILVNVLVVLKLQQLNIELLWEAYASGKPPVGVLVQVRESNRRLTDSMDQMATAILTAHRTVNSRPD
jgi:hypothetical protein